MRGNERYRNVIGGMGVLCLALYWAIWFAPKVADTRATSSFAKLVLFGIFLASAPLTIFAAIRGSKWWWVSVAAAAITLWDLYERFMTPMV